MLKERSGRVLADKIPTKTRLLMCFLLGCSLLVRVRIAKESQLVGFDEILSQYLAHLSLDIVATV